VLALAGCGSSLAVASHHATSPRKPPGASATCTRRSGFELSLVSDRGGQATPVAAATWFAEHGHIADIPRSGWRLTHKKRNGATVVSGPTVLDAIRGSDGTWMVDGGYRCS
jgi:hypothetical protein